jgi:hypothetical protein
MAIRLRAGETREALLAVADNLFVRANDRADSRAGELYAQLRDITLMVFDAQLSPGDSQAHVEAVCAQQGWLDKFRTDGGGTGERGGTLSQESPHQRPARLTG